MVDERRRRRRQRRAGAVAGFMVLALGLAWFFESQATTTIIFVRYADVAQDMTGDPGLSPAGSVRAAELSRVLRDVDVVQGVDAIYTTPTRRTHETAEPLARALDLPVEEADPSDPEALVEQILKEHKGEIVLVVSEPDVMPVLIRELHGSKKVPPMADAEHDNLYIVSIPWYGKVKTLRLRYGAHSPVVPATPPPGA